MSGPLEQAQRPEKRFVNAQARAALRGATLHRIEDDRGGEVFVLTKWNLTRELQTLEQVIHLLDRMEGRA